MLYIGLLIFLIIFCVSLSTMKNEIKKINKIVDEDLNNIDTENRGAVNIIVPDDVDTSDPTLHSTQDIDCKKYTVGQTSGINVEIIKKSDKKVEDAVTSSSDNEDDDPIKNF